MSDPITPAEPEPTEAEPIIGTRYTAAKAIYGAIVGAVAAGLTATATALLPDSANVVAVTPAEGVGIALAVVLALPVVGGTVYGVTNRAKPVTTGNGGPV